MSKDYVRGIHVSPGVYTNEVELSYSNPSLGITTLGLVGETVKGPAFEPIAIEDWTQFQNYFGGTNPEKFKGTQYPKYELPYIAKSYLTQSSQLYVTRVLGFSGYNAGPVWLITAKYSKEYLQDLEGKTITATDYCDEDGGAGYCQSKPSGDHREMVVAVLRSRGHYNNVENLNGFDPCMNPEYSYDVLKYNVTNGENVKLSAYFDTNMNYAGCDPETTVSGKTFEVNANNYGRFTIDITTDDGKEYHYPVSLNPTDKDYIIGVLGTKQEDGDAPIYVEELYDVALAQMIQAGNITYLNPYLSFSSPIHINERLVGAPVDDIMTRPEENGVNGLNRSLVGKRYLAGAEAVANSVTVHKMDNKGGLVTNEAGTYQGTTTFLAEMGHIYTVQPFTLADGQRVYYYVENEDENLQEVVLRPTTGNTTQDKFVFVKSYERYFCLSSDGADVVPVGCDFNNYKSMYTHAVTPWIVSEIKGDAVNLEVNRLFRFHSITDGNFANQQVKISIYNIRPDDGTFDVAIRDFNDSDNNTTVLESYTRCNLIPGDSNYIGYRIGTSDGNYEAKSSYVTVEVNETDKTEASIPAGFMGFPVRNYKGMQPNGNQWNLDAPVLRYNTTWDEDVRNNRQYFGMSDLVGVDVDVLNFKGVDAYDNESDPGFFTPGFHLDSRIDDTVAKYTPKSGTSEYSGQTGLDELKKYEGLGSDGASVSLDAVTVRSNNGAATLYGWSTGETAGAVTTRVNVDNLPDNFNNALSALTGDQITDVTFTFYTKKDVSVTVDGMTGFTWETVSEANTLPNGDKAPVIGKETDMEGTIYEYVNLRKFTVCMYGGFDGWDVYRDSRTNTDEYKMSRYKGSYDKTTGDGTNFSRLDDPQSYNLDEQGITSDYYAYLSAVRAFANKDLLRINLFATPGIDYVNNLSLVEEVIDMIEDERQDSLYVVTTPDKPSGATDDQYDMYTPDDAVANLEYSEITSSYVTTYYPWVKYLDTANNQYVYLPATKDAVRDMAATDNSSYPWYAPAGITRGDVECVRAKKALKLAEEDTLTEAHINPVKTFAVDGVKIWGNRNLLPGDYISSQVSVRRLMLRLRQLIVDACQGLIFEPNDPTVRTQFTSIVTPILDNVRSNRGISDYRIKVDNSTEALDTRDLTAVIYVKPYNALEYVNLTFVITPQGLDFEDIL